MEPELDPSLKDLEAGRPPTHEPATLLANSLFMLLARAFTLASGGALIVYAARTFSVSEYGRYAVAVAIMAIFALLSELGISALALREMSPHEARRAQILGVTLVAEIVTSVIAAVLLVPAGLALGYSSAVLVLLAIAGASLLFQGLLPPIDTTFKAQRVLVYAAVLTVVQSAVTAGVGFALVALGAGPVGLMTALLVGAAAAVPVGFFLLKKELGIVPTFDGARRRVLPFLRASAPIGFTGAITAIYERVDVVMVSKLGSSAAAAIYSIPLTIVQYSLVVPAIIGTAFFPLFANTLRADPASARDSFFLVSRLLLFASVPIALVLAIGGGDIVTTLFGDRYHGSGGVLLVLGWNIILGFQIFLLWYGLLAAHRERGMAVLMATGLALNVGLNFGLIPAYGPKGAAAALLVSDGFVVAGQAALLHRTVFELPFAQVLVKPLVAGALTVPVVLAIRPHSELLAGVVAAALFASLLLGSRYISRTEWEPLTTPVTRLLARGR
jgi:O-antigen/teichoic acid export membrane protein